MSTDDPDLLVDVRRSIEVMEQRRLLAPLSTTDRVFYNWLLSREQELLRSAATLALTGTGGDGLDLAQPPCVSGYRERLQRIWPAQA